MHRKNKIMKTRQTWEAPSPRDEKLLEMETTISSLKAKLEEQKKKSPRKSNKGDGKFSKYQSKGGGKGYDKARPKLF